MALALLVLVVWVADKFTMETDERVSIAVLPFQNLSGDPATEPFVNGLHEDLIIRLSNIDGLTVISKASASSFAESSLSSREIAERLGVSTILQAGVQRSGSPTWRRQR